MSRFESTHREPPSVDKSKECPEGLSWMMQSLAGAPVQISRPGNEPEEPYVDMEDMLCPPSRWAKENLEN